MNLANAGIGVAAAIMAAINTKPDNSVESKEAE